MKMETRICLCDCGGRFRVSIRNKINYFYSLAHVFYALDSGIAVREAEAFLALRKDMARMLKFHRVLP